MSIHIRSLQEHVQLSLTDTCQSFPVLLRTGPNNYIEYKADDQKISFNVRNGESSHFEVSLIWPEFANRHEKIRDTFFSGAGIRLQNLDSNMLAHVINDLTAREIPCLTIHDSFIVTRQNEEYLAKAMDRAMDFETERLLGKAAVRRIKRSTSEDEMTPWQKLRTYRRGYDPKYFSKLNEYLTEQRQWVRGLEEGNFPEYYRRLVRYREIQWDKEYFRPAD